MRAAAWELLRIYRGWLVLAWHGGPPERAFVASYRGTILCARTLAGLFGLIRERERQT